MAGKVLNQPAGWQVSRFVTPAFAGRQAHKQRSGLTGNAPQICHYSYNLPLVSILGQTAPNPKT
jgi:hypothetical protein